MSPTCRRHVADIAKCRQILADIACRCDTEEAPTYPIYINYYRQVQISPNIQVPSFQEFLCLSSNNNHEITTCRESPNMSSNVVSFWTPCRHDFSCVCDMTSNVSRHVADTTQNVAVWATKLTRRHPTCGAKPQTATPMVNGAGNAFTLVTYAG